METKRKVWVIGMMVWIFSMASIVEAKSVYAVANHSSSKINAYLVDPNGTVGFQKTIDNTEHFGNGATGLCVWPSIDRMFVTYESDARIAWGSTKTLRRDTDDEIYAPESSLAGVVTDETNSVLYVVTRSGGHLYTYTFDQIEDTLVLVHPNDPSYPNRTYRQLEGLEFGYTLGLALDADGGPLYFGSIPTGILYVANGTSTVRYYNTMTWELSGSVDMGMSAVGIDVDGDDYLYAGGYPSHNYLICCDLNGDPNDPNTVIEKNMGYNITDIIVDRESGILYTTTRQVIDGRIGAVEVYDPAYWDTSDPNEFYLDMESGSNFGGPAGIGIGSQYKPDNGMFIAKIDDVAGCIEPNDVFCYDITFHVGPFDEPNVVITDKLPEGVNFVSADPNTGYYTERPTHTYTWELDNISGWDPNVPGDPNYYFELTVQVNNHAEPEGTVYNRVWAESDISYVEDDEETDICWWGGNTIYVDKYAPGPHIGTTWETAYLNLTDALDRAALAADPNAVEIRVADGVYKPGIDPSDDYFDVFGGPDIYGGYAGYGAADPNDRDWKKYKTILSGFISDTSRNERVIAMGNNSLLDGFVVEKGDWHGIDGSDVTCTIKNCIIKNISDIGINCEDGNLTVQWCEIKGNGEQGIYHEGSDYSLTVEHCQIHDNEQDGIHTISSTLEIKNSVIYQNGSGGTYYGINLVNPSDTPDIYNNTIVDNINEGIRFVGSNTPDIRNCIVYYNGGDSQLTGLNPDTVADYCCIQDCNEIQTNFNFNDDPNFVYDTEPYGYYHIKYESECRNTGDNNAVEAGDVDMDNTERKQENIVDVGADEVSCEDTWDENDWTYDGVINMKEFAIFSAAWLSHDPNDPDITTDPNYIGEPNYVDPNTYAMWQETWNPICDFDDDFDVELDDFASFCENWLWQACWRVDYAAVMYGMSGGGNESMMMAAPALMSTLADYEPQPVPEKSITEQILDLEDCIELLEKIWLEDPYIQQEIDPDDWKRFMDSVYEILDDLQAYSIQKE